MCCNLVVLVDYARWWPLLLGAGDCRCYAAVMPNAALLLPCSAVRRCCRCCCLPCYARYIANRLTLLTCRALVVKRIAAALLLLLLPLPYAPALITVMLLLLMPLP